MANVVLIGATGFVGSAVLNELLSRGHKVTAVVRNSAKLPQSDNLTAVEEDVANVDAIANIAKGKDAVISAYNPGWSNPDIKRLIEVNYPKIVEAVKKSGVGRLLIVGGAGTLFVKPGLRVVDSGAIPAEIMDGVRPLGNFYLHYLTKEHDLDWVFFSPAGAFDEKGSRTRQVPPRQGRPRHRPEDQLQPHLRTGLRRGHGRRVGEARPPQGALHHRILSNIGGAAIRPLLFS